MPFGGSVLCVDLMAEARSPRHRPAARSEGAVEPLPGLEPGGSGRCRTGRAAAGTPLSASQAAGDGTGGREGRKQPPFINTPTLHIYEAAHHSLIE